MTDVSPLPDPGAAADDPARRILELRAIIEEANRAYYELDAATMPDAGAFSIESWDELSTSFCSDCIRCGRRMRPEFHAGSRNNRDTGCSRTGVGARR